MNLVTSTQIGSPKIKVSPPFWAWTLFWIISIFCPGVITQLPINNIIVKYGLFAIYSLVLSGVLVKQFKGDLLVTMQANRHGLYFQENDSNRYFRVPWENTGQIEKANFPLNKRGVRIEVIGDLVEQIKNSKDIGNAFTENGRTYIYTIPQLRDRDKLIPDIESLRAQP